MEPETRFHCRTNGSLSHSLSLSCNPNIYYVEYRIQGCMAEWLYLVVGTFLAVTLIGLVKQWMEQRHERKMAEIVETPANDPREEQGEYYDE